MIDKLLNTPECNPLTWRMRSDFKPVWLSEYKNKNGYLGMFRAYTDMSSDEIITLVKDSGLRGRGGGGFSTGLKWSMIPKVEMKGGSYLICNADEMEPGTYKDRFLMERLPHLLIEGILIAAYAIQAYRGYIFLRYEYIEAAKYLRYAIQEAKEAGLIGENIFGTGFNFDLFVHTGAGRYICGEETALISSLEGYRPIPRAKPPFPTVIGAWGKPTCVNNVETLCNIPAICEHGLNWYKDLSPLSCDTGTKLMGFSGQVKNPGIWELPFGITAREVLEDYSGGMFPRDLKLKAWLPGGASTGFLTESHLDVSMDFDNVSKVGSRLGTAMSIAIGNNVSIISLIRNLEDFFARESCGWCTPCRDGLPWILKILIALEHCNGIPEDIVVLQHMSNFLSSGRTFCAHAPGAMEPLKSALIYFKNEFESGITSL